MKKKTPSTDVNRTTVEILQTMSQPRMSASAKKAMEKNSAAVAFGRSGRLKSGKAEADKAVKKNRKAERLECNSIH